MSIWGAVGQIGASLAGSAMDFYSNKKSQQHQQNFEEDMAKHAVQYRKADLEAAGFNPLLAVGQAAATPGVSSAAPSSFQHGVEGAMSRVMQQKQLNLATASASAAAERDRAAARLTDEQARGAKIENDFRAGLVGSQINLNQSSAFAHESQGKLNFDMRGEVQARIENLRADTSVKNVTLAVESLRTAMQRLDIRQAIKLIPLVQEVASKNAQLSENERKANEGVLGELMAYLRLILGPVEQGAGISRDLKSQ